MRKVTDITVLNIDDAPYAVDSLSEEVKDLVSIFNDWSRKEAEVRDELMRFHAAKEALSAQIVNTVRKDLAAEAEAAETPASVDAAIANADAQAND